MSAIPSMNISDVAVSLNAKGCEETFCTAINGKGKEHWVNISDSHREFALHITQGANFRLRSSRLIKVRVHIDGVFRCEKDWSAFEQKKLVLEQIPVGLRGRKDRPLVFGDSTVVVTMQEASPVSGKWKGFGAVYFREFHIKEVTGVQAKKGKKAAVKRPREADDQEEARAEKRGRFEVESKGTASQKAARASRDADKISKQRRKAAGELAVSSTSDALVHSVSTTAPSTRHPLATVSGNKKLPSSSTKASTKSSTETLRSPTPAAQLLTWLECHKRTSPPTEDEFQVLKDLVKSIARLEMSDLRKSEKGQVELVLNLLYHVRHLFGGSRTMRATSSRILSHHDLTCLSRDGFRAYLDTLKECGNWIGRATLKTLEEWAAEGA